MPKLKNPKTPAEWQEAVNAAHVMSSIADCMMYGLLTGPDVNVARCDELLEQGAHLGIRPEQGLIEKCFPGAKK